MSDKVSFSPSKKDASVGEAVAGEKRPASSAGQEDRAQKKATSADGRTTVKGSCHCGKVTYTADLTPDENGRINATRCNCTYCTKLAATNIQLKISENCFKLLTPASKDEVGDYKGTSDDGHRYFCKDCSVLIWQEGTYEINGQKFEFFAVNVSSIDQPQDGIDLSEVKLKYFDGLHDNWFAELQEKPWSGGLI